MLWLTWHCKWHRGKEHRLIWYRSELRPIFNIYSLLNICRHKNFLNILSNFGHVGKNMLCFFFGQVANSWVKNYLKWSVPGNLLSTVSKLYRACLFSQIWKQHAEPAVFVGSFNCIARRGKTVWFSGLLRYYWKKMHKSKAFSACKVYFWYIYRYSWPSG